MRRWVAAILAALLLLLTACAEKEVGAAILCGANGEAAALRLKEERESLTVSLAEDEAAALDQVSRGAAEFAIVSEAALRQAITGDNGVGLDNLIRVSDLSLGSFFALSRVGQAEDWPFVLTVAVVGEKDSLSDTLAAQFLEGRSLAGTRYVSAEEAASLIKKKEVDLALGFFIQGDPAVEDMVAAGARICAVPEGISLACEDPSVKTEVLSPLYDGMPRTEAFHLYGALVSTRTVAEEERSRLLAACSALGLQPGETPIFTFD